MGESEGGEGRSSDVIVQKPLQPCTVIQGIYIYIIYISGVLGYNYPTNLKEPIPMTSVVRIYSLKKHFSSSPVN